MKVLIHVVAATEVVSWWASGAQSAQLLKDGEADVVAIWNGRAGAAIRQEMVTISGGLMTSVDVDALNRDRAPAFEPMPALLEARIEQLQAARSD